MGSTSGMQTSVQTSCLLKVMYIFFIIILHLNIFLSVLYFTSIIFDLKGFIFLMFLPIMAIVVHQNTKANSLYANLFCSNNDSDSVQSQTHIIQCTLLSVLLNVKIMFI